MAIIGFSLLNNKRQYQLIGFEPSIGFEHSIGSTIATANEGVSPSPPKIIRKKHKISTITDNENRELWLNFHKKHGLPPGYKPSNQKR